MLHFISFQIQLKDDKTSNKKQLFKKELPMVKPIIIPFEIFIPSNQTLMSIQIFAETFYTSEHLDHVIVWSYFV